MSQWRKESNGGSGFPCWKVRWLRWRQGGRLDSRESSSGRYPSARNTNIQRESPNGRSGTRMPLRRRNPGGAGGEMGMRKNSCQETSEPIDWGRAEPQPNLRKQTGGGRNRAKNARDTQGGKVLSRTSRLSDWRSSRPAALSACDRQYRRFRGHPANRNQTDDSELARAIGTKTVGGVLDFGVMVRMTVALLSICFCAKGQFSGLATPGDGSRVYFATTLRQKNTTQPTYGKLFQVTPRVSNCFCRATR